MNGLIQDVQYALRQLRKHPGFTAIAVLTLAVSIGANAAIFSLVDQVLLKRLPVVEPDRLVMLNFTGSDTGHTDSYGGNERDYFSYPMYRDLRDQNTVFEGMLAMFPAQVGVQWHNTPSLANSELVSGNYFSVLGLKPAVGRLFIPEDTATRGAAPLVVLGYRYWVQHFAADPSVVNQGILINGNPFTIVGVAQPGFNSVIGGTVPDFFVPITMKAQMTPQWDELEDHRSKWLSIIARLKPGITVQQAQAGINPLWKSLRAVELQSISGRSEQFREHFVAKSSLILLDGSKGFSPMRENMRVPLLILMGMVGLLTVMATANVGSLLLVRAAGRNREIAVRYSLGASRGRVIRQLLIEGLALGILGGSFGVALSPLLEKALITLVNPTAASGGMNALTATPDYRVILFSFAVSVAASLLFSLAPIIQFYRPQVTPALKQQTGTAELAHARFRRLTVGVQIGLSLLLLVGAGLFARTLANLKSVDVGFVPEHLLTFQLDPHLAGYQTSAVPALYKRLIETLRSQPGVQSVGMTDDPVLANSNDTFNITVPGYQAPEGERNSFEWERVTPGYFSTLHLPVVAGRGFTDADSPTSLRVVTVNQSFVKRFFGTPDQALGKTFTVGGRKDKPLTIVGVVKDAKHSNLHEPPVPIFYTPIFQETEPNSVAVYIRTSQAPEAVASSVRAAVAGIDSKLVVDSLQSMNSEIDTTLTSERLLSFLASSFGVVAAFFAAIGLYGVLAYSIAQRTREIGIRMALGATRRAVVSMVLREVLTVTGWSVAIAVPLSIVLASLVKSQLFGISYRDPATLLLVTLAIGVLAMLAATVPARRAVRVQPITALRYE
ncbi:MAG TPA: ABC transporter permease [Candidatus Sulfotelmatobacter sp.]|nr:ABC transporter permease [Candidatus Sulfotelmatobacter sp.]